MSKIPSFYDLQEAVGLDRVPEALAHKLQAGADTLLRSEAASWVMSRLEVRYLTALKAGDADNLAEIQAKLRALDDIKVELLSLAQDHAAEKAKREKQKPTSDNQ